MSLEPAVATVRSQAVAFRTDSENIWVEGDTTAVVYAMTVDGDEIFLPYQQEDDGSLRFSAALLGMWKPLNFLLCTSGLSEVRIAASEGAVFELLPARRERPIVILSTSDPTSALAENTPTPDQQILASDSCVAPIPDQISVETLNRLCRRLDRPIILLSETTLAPDPAALRCTLDQQAPAAIVSAPDLPALETTLDQQAPAAIVSAPDLSLPALEARLREVLDEPVGEAFTTIPREQNRDPYDWPARHQAKLAEARGGEFDLVIIGDSITHFWEDRNGVECWNEMMPERTLNLGFGFDRLENALWRVYHDELYGMKAKRIVMFIGTNNIPTSTDDEIVIGMEHLLRAVRARQAEAQIVVCGILPRPGAHGERVAPLNARFEQLAHELGMEFINPGRKLMIDGEQDFSCFKEDALHPNEEGYRRIAGEIIGR